MDFPGHFEQIFQQLNYQRVHGQLCDCVIVVGSRHFKAHRAVLAACSTHFRALFSVSEGDGSVSVIRLDSEVVTSEAFSVLVDMMYTSTLTLGESNVMDVLLAASHLHLNTVVKACKHYLNTRTLPKSPQGERGGQRVEQQQMSSSSTSHLQRSFLLQQLGLSVVSSALNEEAEEEACAAGRGAGSGLLDQRDSFTPPRRLQKRRQNFSLIRSDAENQRQRPRLPSQSQGAVDECPEGGVRGEELLSPDSHGKTMDEDSKLDVVVIAADDRDEYRRASVQEDMQVPSQSDGGRGSRAEPVLLPRKEEYPGGDEVQVKGGGEEDAARMKVVVKSEPISSPEPPDETSDVMSQAEGSDQVEAVGEKLELSPEGSEHSFSDPQPSSDILISEIKGPVMEGERLGDTGGGVDSRRERGGGLLSTMSFDRVSVPNTTTGECTLDHEPPRFLFGSESSSSMHLPPSQNLLSGEAQDFSSMRADSLLLQPMLDGIASSSEQLAMEFQRNICRGGAFRFPPYRRIAPKNAPGGALMQDVASSSSSSSSSMLVNGANYDGSSQRGSNSNPLPQLTRASADVLSKCKKALSEHNVLVVEGARKYACKICCKTFLTLTDCKKHIRVHTGEKPYACLKCGKRFSQSSHLYKHSKTTCLRWQNTTMPTGLL